MSTGIKEKRETANLSQEKLARLMNVSVSTVRRWDKSIHNISFADTLQLSELLNCSLDELADIATNDEG